MNNDRAQLQKLGDAPLRPTLSAVFCVHCGRVYIIDDKHGREDCACGAELHPVAKTITLGEELRCGDGYEIRAQIGSNPRLEIDIDGYVDEKGIKYIGKAIKQPDGKWACLANIAGALCLVEVVITPKTIKTATDKCDVCGTSDHGDQRGWGIRGTTLHCPKCLARIHP